MNYHSGIVRNIFRLQSYGQELDFKAETKVHFRDSKNGCFTVRSSFLPHTSSDLDVSLDLFILRYSQKSLFPKVEKSYNWYAQLGKFGKPERQENRRL